MRVLGIISPPNEASGLSTPVYQTMPASVRTKKLSFHPGSDLKTVFFAHQARSLACIAEYELQRAATGHLVGQLLGYPTRTSPLPCPAEEKMDYVD